MKPKHFLIIVCIMILGFSGCGVSEEDFEEKVGELEAAKQEVVKIETQIKEKDAKIAELEKRRREDAKKLAALQQEIDSGRKNKEALDKYVREMGTLRSQNASIQQQLTEKAAKMTHLQSQLDKLQLSSLGSASELSSLKALVSSKDAALNDKDAQINAKDSELLKKNSQIDALMKQLDSLKKGNIPGMGGAGGLLPR